MEVLDPKHLFFAEFSLAEMGSITRVFFLYVGSSTFSQLVYWPSAVALEINFGNGWSQDVCKRLSSLATFIHKERLSKVKLVCISEIFETNLSRKSESQLYFEKQANFANS